MKGINEHPYIESLIEKCNKANKARPITKIKLDDIESFRDTSLGNCIYVIEEVDGNSEATFAAFETFKKESDFACSRLNQPSKILYVGSSTTGVKNRLRQHLVKGPLKTYALHMGEWFKGDYQGTILEYNVEREVLQIIEDSISFNLKPAFGKQGGNNKT